MAVSPGWKWLHRYASYDKPDYKWQTLDRGHRRLYHRPLGLVETLFDADGRLFEGRSDLNALLTLEIRSHREREELRALILTVWTRLRLEHALLRSKARSSQELGLEGDDQLNGRHFVVEQPKDLAEAYREASNTIVFLEDHYSSVDADDFYKHAQNTARIVDPAENLARLFVLPLSQTKTGSYKLELLFVTAHQISEGLTIANWLSHMILLFNLANPRDGMSALISESAVKRILPLAQETLYPPILGSVARQRWFWAITLILRHIHHPLPDALANTLRRAKPLPSGSARRMNPTYAAVLNYSEERTPPLNTFRAVVYLSSSVTRRHHRLCREAGVSIGAGGFAFAALVMMELEEERNPDVPESDRKPLILSFPLNPRAMFDSWGPPDSLMLAFSDGIVLPFLPSRLPLEGRFRLLAKQAHRQLRVYQKRAQKTKAEQAEKNTTRVLANNYIMSAERCAAKSQPEGSSSSHFQPQGEYPIRPNPSKATHGISSIGSYKWPLVVGGHDLEMESTNRCVADFRKLEQGVRARDDEFLVGIGGDKDYLWLSVAYDGNAIDPDRVLAWKEKCETVLLSADTGSARL